MGRDVSEEGHDHQEPPEAGDAGARRVGDGPGGGRPREEDEAGEREPERVERDAHPVAEQPDEEDREPRREHRHQRNQAAAHGPTDYELWSTPACDRTSRRSARNGYFARVSATTAGSTSATSTASARPAPSAST